MRTELFSVHIVYCYCSFCSVYCCLFFRRLSLSTNCIEKITNLNGLS